MGTARVLVGPARGHRFQLESRSGIGQLWRRASIAIGRYEPRVTSFLAENLRSCRVFFDIGASTGYYTRIALRLMDPTSRIVALEPDPRLATHLRSAFQDARLSVRPEAAGRDDHEAVLEHSHGLASRIRSESLLGPGFVAGGIVKVRSLDGMVERGELPSPDVVKIDVEGGELLVLEGMSRLLEHQPALAVECHSMSLLGEVLRTVNDRAYNRVEVTRGGDGIGPSTVLAR
ncbi:MAG: FkbM family methyltransferase [Actinobacteria bacterium]|nr:MAG: FkbM family methyltransferase [Actinomycetota bacterium]